MVGIEVLRRGRAGKMNHEHEACVAQEDACFRSVYVPPLSLDKSKGPSLRSEMKPSYSVSKLQKFQCSESGINFPRRSGVGGNAWASVDTAGCCQGRLCVDQITRTVYTVDAG